MAKDSLKEKREKLLKKAKNANGKTFKDIDFEHLLETGKKNKGNLGQIFEIYLGKPLDNKPDPDFKEEQLELKVTGLLPTSKKKKGAYRAKERLVLHNINFNEDYKLSFEKSGLLEKCKALLITCYEYIRSSDKNMKAKFPIIDSFIFEIPEKDKKILKHDYDTIMGKVKKGIAEQISESDTEYLAACTKASDSTKRTSQPFSSVPVKPRAFSLKSSYATEIIKKFISNASFLESINSYTRRQKETQEVEETLGEYDSSIEKTILDRLESWYGKNEEEICHALNISTNAKNRFAVYFSRMLQVKDWMNIEEFKKANIVVKTIRLNRNETIKENMSFRLIRFKEIAETPWDESDERTYFSEAKFLFVVFEETPKGYVFKKVVFYNLTDEVIENFIATTYEKTRDTIMNGNIVRKTITRKLKGISVNCFETNFVGSKENPICHVRPHARNQKDTYPLPIKDKVTGLENYEKQCFWLDRRFIKAIVEGKDKEYIEKAKKKLSNPD